MCIYDQELNDRKKKINQKERQNPRGAKEKTSTS